MITRFYYLFISLAFFASCGNDAPGPSNGKKKRVDTVEKKKKEKVKPGLVEGLELFRTSKTPFDDAFGRSGDTLFFCSRKGVISVMDTTEKKKNKILNLKAEFMVDQIFIVPRSGHKWFIVWQETDHEGVISFSALFNEQDEKPEWKHSFRVPNPGKPVVDGDAAYISTLGMVGKISVNDGSFMWKHDSLFNKKQLSFQKVEKALVYRDKVIFVDYPIPGKRERRDTLVLDPISGVRKK